MVRASFADGARGRDREMAGRVIFVTGDLYSAGSHEFITTTGRPSVKKPIDINELRELIGTALEAPHVTG